MTHSSHFILIIILLGTRCFRPDATHLNQQCTYLNKMSEPVCPCTFLSFFFLYWYIPTLTEYRKRYRSQTSLSLNLLPLLNFYCILELGGEWKRFHRMHVTDLYVNVFFLFRFQYISLQSCAVICFTSDGRIIDKWLRCLWVGSTRISFHHLDLSFYAFFPTTRFLS